MAEGNTYRFNVWVFHDSDSGSGSQTRVGIGSNVGGNPLGSPITWSPWMTAIDSWQEVTVEATVPAGSITVFIYSTQSSPNAGNQNYYDDAELILVSGEGTVDVGDGQEGGEGTVAPPPPPTSTPRTFAPFVNAQPTQESGRVVHTVQPGDTLAAIAVAYGVPSSEILELNNLTRDQARFLAVGQQLIISEGNPDAEVEVDETEEVEETEDADGDGFASPTPQEEEDEEEPTDIPTPTEIPTEEEVEETEEPTPDFSPTPTEIPATPTNAPTAPVEQGDESDPLEIDTGVCTIMFDDLNANNIQDADEEPMSGGQISVEDSSGEIVQEYVTDGSEPFCFEELDAGTYTMRGVAPDGYGLNIPVRAVSVQAGQVFTVPFAAVEGLEVAVVPTVDTTAGDDDPAEIIEEEPDPISNIRNVAGIIVLAIAGAVLLGGIVVGVIIGRN